MKAFFIYRNGEKFGNPTGYTTEKGAKKSLVGCEDWHNLLRPYQLLNAKEDISDEMKATGFYRWSEYTKCWLFDRAAWSRKIWTPYVREHYKFIEQDYEINTK